jgi:hypothetical protein
LLPAFALLASLGLLAGACSSDASEHPSAIGASGGAQGQAGSADAGFNNAGSSSAAGAGGDLGNAGIADGAAARADTSAGTAGDPGTGEPPVPPSACSETAVWSNAKDVGVVSSAAAEMLLSVTPDELDLAFLRGGSLYVAHRDQVDASFALASAVALPPGWTAAQGAALSPDGKRLVLVSDPGQKSFGEMTRLTRDAAFNGEVDESAFATVNEDAVYTGKLYAYPAVSPGDTQLFFNSTFTMGASTVVVSTRNPGGTWSAPVVLSSQVFDGTDAQRRLPTGVSADERTLFYFNEESMQEEARFRDTPTLSSPLYDMVSLGARRGAAPNTACNRLYSDASGIIVVETD